MAGSTGFSMKPILLKHFAVLLLAVIHTQIFAESPLDALWRQHAKLQGLAAQVVRDQTRLTESPSQILANRPALDQLMACSDSLLSAARERAGSGRLNTHWPGISGLAAV
jgi:hypothetical protein